jgi:hypothetical protein
MSSYQVAATTDKVIAPEVDVFQVGSQFEINKFRISCIVCQIYSTNCECVENKTEGM